MESYMICHSSKTVIYLHSFSRRYSTRIGFSVELAVGVTFVALFLGGFRLKFLKKCSILRKSCVEWLKVPK